MFRLLLEYFGNMLRKCKMKLSCLHCPSWISASLVNLVNCKLVCVFVSWWQYLRANFGKVGDLVDFWTRTPQNYIYNCNTDFNTKGILMLQFFTVRPFISGFYWFHKCLSISTKLQLCLLIEFKPCSAENDYIIILPKIR